MKKTAKFLFPLLLVAILSTSVTAHSGRTDYKGGHHDYKNVSGLGYYHYHCGGFPAHLHTNGVCPYAGYYESVINKIRTSGSPWKLVEKDSKKYLYNPNSFSYYKGFYKMNGNKYYFNDDYSMQTGWAEIDEKKYFFTKDGIMLTGIQHSKDGKELVFSEDGVFQGEGEIKTDNAQQNQPTGLRLPSSLNKKEEELPENDSDKYETTYDDDYDYDKRKFYIDYYQKKINICEELLEEAYESDDEFGVEYYQQCIDDYNEKMEKYK